jgi:hypothetical protein
MGRSRVVDDQHAPITRNKYRPLAALYIIYLYLSWPLTPYAPVPLRL